MTASDHLSETDVRILEILQADGRRAYADLGARIGISGPSAHERVKKLEARGVIRGYTAVVDPTAVGLGIVGFTWITQAPGTSAVDLTAVFEAIPEIEECHQIAGEADYIVKVRARDTRDLQRVLRQMQSTPHVFTTETDVVLSTGFEGRPLALRAATPDSGADEAPSETSKPAVPGET